MKITDHAKKRLKERKIKLEDVCTILERGIKMVNKHHSDRFTFKSRTSDLYVVTDGDMKVVITVFFGKSITGYKK